MKTIVINFALAASLLLTGCVQKSYKHVVVLTLDVSKEEGVNTAGVRGNGNPLNWDADYPMREVVKDSLYRAVITTKTGYLFAEIKCTVNGNFELQDEENRRIAFDTKHDTTFVNLVFNKK